MNGLLSSCCCCILSVALLFISCHGYTYMVPMEFGNECIDDNSTSYSVGSVWYDDEQCEKLQCIQQRGALYILAYGCSTISPSEECWIVPGSKENYPQCCPDIECPPGME